MIKTKLATLAALALGATLAIGCTSSSEDEVIFHATWTVSDPGGPATCADFGAEKTSFLFTQASNQMGFDELFDCEAGAGDTVPLPLDNYTWVASMLDCPDTSPGCPNSTTVVMSDPQTENTEDCINNPCLVDLPTVDFIFD